MFLKLIWREIRFFISIVPRSGKDVINFSRFKVRTIQSIPRKLKVSISHSVHTYYRLYLERDN